MGCFSHLPFGGRLHYLAQRRITRTLPRPAAKLAEAIAVASEHVALLQALRGGDLANAVFYEFGAGCDLVTPLVFSAFGVRHQIVIDRQRLARPALVNDAVARIGALLPPSVPGWRATSLPSGEEFHEACSRSFGIHYLAPCDARATPLESGSVDCVTSTNTLEHVPQQDIESLLWECCRLLRPGGLLSFRIDYKDHYSRGDLSLSVYNFLRYSEAQWRFFSPAFHYQNRLRHSDYLKVFERAGLRLLVNRPQDCSAEDLEVLRRLPVDERFRRYDLRDLAVRSAVVVLQKP